MVSLDVFEHCRDAVIAADDNGRVTMVNRAASALFGIDRRTARGMWCWELARLFTEEGDALCSSSCSIQRELSRNRVVVRERGEFHSGRGERIAVEVSTIPLKSKSASRSAFLHTIVQSQPQASGVSLPDSSLKQRPLKRDVVAEILTPREIEVLELLSQGRPTKEVARLLSVSVSTARNHIEHIHAKLGVHRRIDAVLLWLSAPQTQANCDERSLPSDAALQRS